MRQLVRIVRMCCRFLPHNGRRSPHDVKLLALASQIRSVLQGSPMPDLDSGIDLHLVVFLR